MQQSKVGGLAPAGGADVMSRKTEDTPRRRSQRLLFSLLVCALALVIWMVFWLYA